MTPKQLETLILNYKNQVPLSFIKHPGYRTWRDVLDATLRELGARKPKIWGGSSDEDARYLAEKGADPAHLAGVFTLLFL